MWSWLYYMFAAVIKFSTLKYIEINIFCCAKHFTPVYGLPYYNGTPVRSKFRSTRYFLVVNLNLITRQCGRLYHYPTYYLISSGTKLLCELIIVKRKHIVKVKRDESAFPQTRICLRKITISGTCTHSNPCACTG